MQDHVALRPLDTRDGGAQAQFRALGIETGAQPLDQRVVAAGEAKLFLIALFSVGLAQHGRADAIRMRRVRMNSAPSSIGSARSGTCSG